MNNGQVHLKRLRRIILLFSIIAGALIAARWDALVKKDKEEQKYMRDFRLRYPNAPGSDSASNLIWTPEEKTELALPFVVAAFYIYGLWGKPLKFVHKYLRAVVVLGIAIGWLYITIGVMTGHVMNRYASGFSCGASYDPKCREGHASLVIGAVAGVLMLFEAHEAFKVGPLDPKFQKHQFSANGGYITDANVIIVRPDDVNFQFQPSMQQQQQQHQHLQEQVTPTHLYVQPQPLQYQPSLASPPGTVPQPQPT